MGATLERVVPSRHSELRGRVFDRHSNSHSLPRLFEQAVTRSAESDAGSSIFCCQLTTQTCDVNQCQNMHWKGAGLGLKPTENWQKTCRMMWGPESSACTSRRRKLARVCLHGQVSEASPMAAAVRVLHRRQGQLHGSRLGGAWSLLICQLLQRGSAASRAIDTTYSASP